MRTNDKTVKRVAAVAVAGIMSIGSVAPTMAYADTTVTEEDTAEMGVWVNADNDSDGKPDTAGAVSTDGGDVIQGTWTVTIPDMIALTPATETTAKQPGTYTGTATVSYKGDIGTAQTLTVTPDATFKMKDAKGWSADVDATAAVATDGALTDLSYETVKGTGSAPVNVSAVLGAGSWGGTENFTIYLNGPKVTAQSMTITAAPTKTSYKPGETFDPSGVTFQVIYSDGTTAVKGAGDVSYDKTGELTTDDTQVTFTYTAGDVTLTAVQNITVIEVPDISDSTKSVTLTLAQLEAAKADSTQASNLAAYASTGLLKLQVPMADGTTSTATLVNDADGDLTFMMDTNVTTAAIESDNSLETTNFGGTELYTKLAAGGEIYNLFSADLLNKITPQAKKVSTNYNDTMGAGLTTLAAQKLWLPSYSEVFGTNYNDSYNAGSTAEGARLSAFASTTYTAWKKSSNFWLRSAYCSYSSSWLVVDDGYSYNFNVYSMCGVRPCFTL